MVSDEDTAMFDMDEILNKDFPLVVAQEKLRNMATEMSSSESRRAFQEQTKKIERQQTLNGLGTAQA